jgi:beta-carotene 3-hydroxylase
MELVAYLTHRYVMHGWLWSWHASHHSPRLGRFERNDRFALVFAAISILLIFIGRTDFGPTFWIGWGMTLYGLIYVVFHDGMVHERLRMPARLKRMRYLKHLVQAHRLHHASHEKNHAVSYGFLYAPPLEKLRADFKAGAAKARPVTALTDSDRPSGHKAL